MKNKIGIMLPRSDMFSTLVKDFLDGFKLVYEKRVEEKNSTSLIIETIGNASGSNVLAVAEKLIFQEEVDLVISFCSYYNLKEFVRIFDSYKKPLIHIDLGGNVLKNEHVSPYVIHHTLNLWQSCYSAGVYAAETYGKRAAFTASYYDGGYNLAESFIKGFTDSGGEVVYNYISPIDYKSESYANMIEGLKSSSPEVVFSLFSYKEGNKVLDVLANSSVNGTSTFFAIPLLTEDTLNHKHRSINNMFSIASWAFDDESKAMLGFKEKYLNIYELAPNVISLLGYEIGLVLNQLRESIGNIPKKIGEEAKTLSYNTPRGELSYNSYNESQVKYFFMRQFVAEGQNSENKVAETIEINSNTDLYEHFKDHPFSGWHNPYIIT